MMATDAKKKNGRDLANLDVLMNVPLQVTAELGKCKMSVSEVLKLGTGSIIELERLAGGPVDLLVNNKLIARGEVVAVDENFGVRVTELVARPQAAS
jgi:flagellar motor switch protein FliN/FliY